MFLSFFFILKLFLFLSFFVFKLFFCFQAFFTAFFYIRIGETQFLRYVIYERSLIFCGGHKRSRVDSCSGDNAFSKKTKRFFFSENERKIFSYSLHLTQFEPWLESYNFENTMFRFDSIKHSQMTLTWTSSAKYHFYFLKLQKTLSRTQTPKAINPVFRYSENEIKSIRIAELQSLYGVQNGS